MNMGTSLEHGLLAAVSKTRHDGAAACVGLGFQTSCQLLRVVALLSENSGLRDKHNWLEDGELNLLFDFAAIGLASSIERAFPEDSKAAG